MKWLSLFVWVLGLGLAGWSIGTRLEVLNPTGQWDPTPTPPEQSRWAFAREQFGDRELVIVAVRLSTESRREAVAAVARLENWVAEQPEIVDVFGPRAVGRLDFELRLPLQPDEMMRLQQAVLSPDGSLARIFATLVPPEAPGSLEHKQRFLSRVRDEGPALLHGDSELLLAGKPVLDIALNDLVSRDARLSVPLALAGMLVILVAILGFAGLAPVVAVLAAVVLLAGALGFAGVPISTATVVALPVTAVVGLSYGLHTTMAVRRQGSAREGLRLVRAPITWAYATTVFALLGFALSSIPAMRSFAWATAFGMTVALITAFGVAPHLVRGGRMTRHAAAPGRAAFRIYTAAARRPRLTLTLWGAVAVLGVAGTLRITLEPNNYLGFFPSDHPAILAHDELDSAFGGSVPLYVLAVADSGVAYDQVRVRERLVTMVDAGTDLVDLGTALLPVDPERRQREPLIQELSAGWFEAVDTRYTRAVVSMPVLPTVEARRVLSTLDSLAAAYSDADVQLQVTGVLHASLPLLAALIDTQVRSLATLLVAVTLVLVVVARSPTRGAQLVIPSILPLVVIAGAMGHFGVVLDFTTVTVFSIVLGVAVDDTLHIALGARRSAQAGAPMAIRRTADAVTLTSLVAVIGFTALWFSPFPATQRVGQLLGLGLMTAWLADVTLTPLLLARRT